MRSRDRQKMLKSFWWWLNDLLPHRVAKIGIIGTKTSRWQNFSFQKNHCRFVLTDLHSSWSSLSFTVTLSLCFCDLFAPTTSSFFIDTFGINRTSKIRFKSCWWLTITQKVRSSWQVCKWHWKRWEKIVLWKSFTHGDAAVAIYDFV